MSILSLQDLSPEALDLLRRHNLLIQAARAEIIADAVSTIELPPEQSEQLWNNHLKQNNLEKPDKLKTKLKALSISEEDLRWQLELPLRINKYSYEHFHHKAEARFLARKEQLDLVVYSLLRVKDAYLARELYLRISGQEANFADLAFDHSLGKEARTKGIVGPVPMTQAHPALAERLRTSQPGELLEPFKIEEWWLVARLERFEAAKFDDKTAQAMACELFQDWIQEKLLCKLAEF
ncbi:peptidylprolyl isomerase [Prochlorococcus marinus]|nr:peptidylprolyl isomerase [Prochlorococcus marinus]KZR78343.1 PPIC-type PPIASE domain protein [Prochlorococcus marinus str. MIT 1323]